MHALIWAPIAYVAIFSSFTDKFCIFVLLFVPTRENKTKNYEFMIIKSQ